MSDESEKPELLTDFPNEILEKILKNLSYHEIAKMRIVCKKFDSISKEILNRESKLLCIHIETYMKEIKTMLPRRESFKRRHPRYKHFRVLRILYLYMNPLMKKYSKYIDKGLCCFNPGKLMDEAIRILNILHSTENLTDYPDKEFRELANMADEHFKEVIEPPLKNIVVCAKTRNSNDSIEHSKVSANNNLESSLCLPSTEKKPSQTFRKTHYWIRRNKVAGFFVKNQIGKIRLKLAKQSEELNELRKRLECIEKKLNCSKEELKNQDSETCEKTLSHILSICEPNSVGSSNVKNRLSEFSADQQSKIQRSNLKRRLTI